jgi:hypothetical protein
VCTAHIRGREGEWHGNGGGEMSRWAEGKDGKDGKDGRERDWRLQMTAD